MRTSDQTCGKQSCRGPEQIIIERKSTGQQYSICFKCYKTDYHIDNRFAIIEFVKFKYLPLELIVC